MRDIGIIVWVVLLLVGVIGSMISSARRQMQQASPPARRLSPPQQAGPHASTVPPLRQAVAPQRPAQPADQKQAAAERPVVRRAPVAPPHDPLPDHPLITTHVARGSKATRRLFSSREGLMAAVIAAEVLGKPVALREYTTY